MITNPERHLNKSQRSGCWRCGALVFSLNGITRLIGGYHAKLCGECLNDCEVYLREHPFVVQFHGLQAEYEGTWAMASGKGEDCTEKFKEIRAKITEVEKQLFTLTETWTDDVIERPAPPPPPPPTDAELTEMRERRKSRLRAQVKLMELEEQRAAEGKTQPEAEMA
jgi:hypothetical protein